MRLVMMSLIVVGLAAGACSRPNTDLDAPIGKRNKSVPPAAVKTPDPEQSRWRDITIPAGTPLSIVLDTGVGSDTSTVEEPVRAHLLAHASARQPAVL